jgi:hypothetical protein
MKNLTLLFFLQIFILNAYSQNIYPEVLSSACGTLSNAQYEVDWTLGEPVIETISGNSIILTQGFHQPHYFLTSIQESPDFSIQIYPNPASSIITIKTSSKQALTAILYDLNGKKLNEIRFTESAELDISSLSESVYLLKITDQDNSIVRLTRIVKTH